MLLSGNGNCLQVLHNVLESDSDTLKFFCIKNKCMRWRKHSVTQLYTICMQLMFTM